MFYKKTLILSSTEGGNEKAVVNIEYNNGEMVGTMKLYNFREEPEGVLTLGILESKEVHKAGLCRVGSFKYAFKLELVKQLSTFSCGLIQIHKGEAKPLLHGATDGSVSSEERLASVASAMGECAGLEEIKKVLDENQIELEDMQEIEQQIDEEICCSSCEDKCATCKYRDAFFGSEQAQEEQKQESFFDGVSEQINSLFARYPEEEFLPSIIPSSKWVKVDYEGDGSYYVLGLIYENDKIKYICYGVPGVYEKNPPEDLTGFAQWLPLDATKPEEYGYWITYQDAEMAKVLKYRLHRGRANRRQRR